MPALQLAAIRQFIGGFIYTFSYSKNTLAQGKQWKTIFILSIVNFVLSNGLSTWGVKYISGLGAIIGAIVPLWLAFTRGERLARLTVMGLIVSFGGICVITII
jgi:drug/metabolite transporter (DMT)-like permease